MLRQITKLAFAVVLTAILGFALNTGLMYIRAQWTSVSLSQVSNNMGNQVAIRTNMNVWNLIWWAVLLVGLLLILGLWYGLYRNQFKTFFLSCLMLLSLLATACTASNFVIITPPNYAIVVNLSSPTDQATGNNFGEGELLNVTQIQVNMTKCALNSDDWCPDKLVAEVQGSPESRIYSKDPNSGTSNNNQALCFEANGANGCVDFSVTAIINKEDAKCYANKMGVKPVLEGDPKVPSRFHFMATPLADALDTRVLQIASSQFAQRVANTSPLTLALTKFSLFDEIKQTVINSVHDQTCITIDTKNMAINNGIVWASPDIQDQINQATVIANQLELVSKQNALLEQQNQAFIIRAEEIEKQFGLPAAVEFMRIQKWNGQYLPIPVQQTGIQPLPTGQPVASPTSIPTP